MTTAGGGQAVYNALGLKAPEKIQKDIFKKGDIKELSLKSYLNMLPTTCL